MAWAVVSEYRARIGGVIYENVTSPFTYNGTPVLSLVRNSDTALLAPTVALLDQRGRTIATVTNGEVDLSIPDEYTASEKENRKSIIERSSGRIVYDCGPCPGPEYEIDLSFLTITIDGFPICCHPDRTKLGSLNSGNRPNIARLSLVTDPGSKAHAVGVQDSPLYVLGIAIRHFLGGSI
jgi:hypothetical protein